MDIYERWEAPQTISAGWTYGNRDLDPARAYTGSPRPGDIKYVRADLLAGAVSVAEVCEFLRSATYENPATGRDRAMTGWKSAADELERHFGGR